MNKAVTTVHDNLFQHHIVSKENITLSEMVIFDSHDEVRMKGGFLTPPLFFLFIDRHVFAWTDGDS